MNSGASDSIHSQSQLASTAETSSCAPRRREGVDQLREGRNTITDSTQSDDPSALPSSRVASTCVLTCLLIAPRITASHVTMTFDRSPRRDRVVLLWALFRRRRLSAPRRSAPPSSATRATVDRRPPWAYRGRRYPHLDASSPSTLTGLFTWATPAPRRSRRCCPRWPSPRHLARRALRAAEMPVDVGHHVRRRAGNQSMAPPSSSSRSTSPSGPSSPGFSQ